MIDQRFAVSVHIMTVLACNTEGLMTSDQLATSIGTNPTVVRRLLSKLVEADLVESFKGKAGGVKLGRISKEISLKEIYMAISDKRLIACPDKVPFDDCQVSCSLPKIFNSIADGVEKSSMTYLAGIRLSEVAAKVAR